MVGRLYTKGLVVGIIILFISMSVLSSVSSKDISISDDKILEDNNEIEPLDMNNEFFTRIKGYFYNITYEKVIKTIYRDVKIYADYGYLTVWGIGLPYFIFRNHPNYVKIPCLILIEPINDNGELGYVNGIAFGDIFWE